MSVCGLHLRVNYFFNKYLAVNPKLTRNLLGTFFQQRKELISNKTIIPQLTNSRFTRTKLRILESWRQQ